MTQEQFPILTELSLVSGEDWNVSALPSEFLGGCTTRLQKLRIKGIPFPTLPTFLSSAADLVTLDLQGIPHTWYISPEAVVAGMAALTRLDVLVLEFQSSTSRPNSSGTSIWAALPTHVVLPALTFFSFRGTGEYFEDLVAQVEASQVHSIMITYLKQHIFYVPQIFKVAGQDQVLEQPRSVNAFFESSGLGIHFQLRMENDHVEVHLNLQNVGPDSH